MKNEDLEHLSKEELSEIFCNFYNNIDKIFIDNRNSKEDKNTIIMNIFGEYQMFAEREDRQ